MKVHKVLSLLGVVMIMIGLGVQSIELYKTVERQEKLIYKQTDEINKLKAENDSLWSNYYMNLSNYEGEYYE